LFSLSVLFIICGRYTYWEGNPVSHLVTHLLLQPAFFVPLGVATAVIVYAGRRRTTHCRWNRTAEWYWWNAWFYHAVLDGCTGSLRAIPATVSQYDVLDKRFVQGDPVPWAVGLVELLLMQPLCLAVVYLILTEETNEQTKRLRYCLEIITCTLQYMGLIVFMLPEVMLQEQIHIPALDPVGVPGNAWANVQLFDPYHLIYYWFGFWFCNGIWAVVPLLRLRAALRGLLLCVEDSNDKTNEDVAKIKRV